MSWRFQIHFIFVCSCINIIKCETFTCGDGEQCSWNCGEHKSCDENVYNCSKDAISCELTCFSCNGTFLYSSNANFNLICIGQNGCLNMNIDHHTEAQNIRVFIVSKPNATLSSSDADTVSTTSLFMQQTQNFINAELDKSNDENDEAMNGMLIFAVVLTVLFFCCICCGILFCIDTRRKSKLRKMSDEDEEEWQQNNNNEYNAVQSKMDTTMDTATTTEQIERQITPYTQTSQTIAQERLQRILMEKEAKKNKVKSPKKALQTLFKKSPKSPKKMMVPQNDDEDEFDDEICEEEITLKINEESITKTNSVKHLVSVFDE